MADEHPVCRPRVLHACGDQPERRRAPDRVVFVLGLTVAVDLPINADQLGWNAPSPPPDWTDVRDRWQTAHAVRTTAGVLAFAALALAAPPPSERTAPP